MTTIHWLEENYNPNSFPPISNALAEPDGLLAAGGDLSVPRLLEAYSNGIFPWYSDDQPILWWSPNPRMVCYLDELHIPKRLRSFLRKHKYTLKFNTAFKKVVQSCAKPRDDFTGTWITDDMLNAYCEMHQQGHAHSLEVWKTENDDEVLVGGIYGVAIGQIFFGESMFSHETNTSKLAFITLVRHLKHWGYQLLDAQVESAHLRTLGCRTIPREQFSVILGSACPAIIAHSWVIIPEILDT